MAELLCEVDLPRSSYFYHRARLQVVDKYVEARQVMTDIFERNIETLRRLGHEGWRRLWVDDSAKI